MIERPTATTSAWSTPKTTTQPVVTPAIATSTVVDRRERPPRLRLDEPDRGEDDHRAEHGLREVLHRLGEEQQDHGDGRGGDEARDLAARAHVVVDGRARAAGADREALGETGRGVGGAHGQQLLGRAHGLVVLAGERARGEDLVGERDEEDAERRRHELHDVAERRARDSKLGSPAGIGADDRDAVRLEVERPRDPDRADHDDERRRKLGA